MEKRSSGGYMVNAPCPHPTHPTHQQETLLQQETLHQQTAIARDSTRMKAAVDAMSRCLSKIMLIKDEELLPAMRWPSRGASNRSQLSAARDAAWKRFDTAMAGLVPFGTLLFEEFSVKATPQQEDRLRELYKMNEFAETTIGLCSSMLEESDEAYEADSYFDSDEEEEDQVNEDQVNDGEVNVREENDGEWSLHDLTSIEFKTNVDLWFYAYSISPSPYFVTYNYTKKNGSPIPVGGMAASLFDEFTRLCTEWLHSCDKIFCTVHDIKCNDNKRLNCYISDLSKAIARRHSLLHHPKDKIDNATSVDSLLIPVALNLQAVDVFWENNAQAFHERKMDVEALEAMLVIAKQGGRTHEAQSILLTKTGCLRRAIENPAQELGLHLEKRSKKFNFAALRKVLDVGIENPFMCRCECAQAWHEAYGEWAAIELQTAIDFVNRDDVRAGTHYLELVGTEREKGCLEMPPNPCAYEELNWFTQKPSYTKRSNLSPIGLRFVCLATFLRKRIESSTMKFGTSNRQILGNVATDHMHKAAYARAMLETDRLQCNQGVELLIFEKGLNDPASHVSKQLDLPFCELSRISFAELDLIFGNKQIFDLVKRDLSRKTREMVSTSVVPSTYISFTDDTLTILLEVIKSRRISHGLNVVMHTDPLADMLRCIPKCAELAKRALPEPEDVVLTLEDLKVSHHGLRGLLEDEAAALQKKRALRPRIRKSQPNHDKLMFVLDGLQLSMLLKS